MFYAATKPAHLPAARCNSISISILSEGSQRGFFCWLISTVFTKQVWPIRWMRRLGNGNEVIRLISQYSATTILTFTNTKRLMRYLSILTGGVCLSSSSIKTRDYSLPRAHLTGGGRFAAV